MTLRKLMAVLVVVVLLGGAMALAQAPAAPPKPGPEHKRFGMYVGRWAGSGEMKPGPMGPGGKMTWTETCEWFAGGFAVLCNSAVKSPMGEGKGHTILTYNIEEKTYVYFGIDSNGTVESSKGSVQGKVWNWASEGKIAGKLYKNRFTITEKSNDAYSFKLEMSGDGGKTWAVVMEGASTRAK